MATVAGRRQRFNHRSNRPICKEVHESTETMHEHDSHENRLALDDAHAEFGEAGVVLQELGRPGDTALCGARQHRGKKVHG